MEDLKKYYDIVEQGITMAGVDATLCRSHTEGQWNLKRSESEIWIDVWAIEQEGNSYFQVMTPLVALPEENRETFYKELLDLNYQMVNACFVTFKEGVYVKITREVDNLTPEEVTLCLSRVGHYGQVFEQGFKKKFQVKKLEHHD